MHTHTTQKKTKPFCDAFRGLYQDGLSLVPQYFGSLVTLSEGVMAVTGAVQVRPRPRDSNAPNS